MPWKWRFVSFAPWKQFTPFGFVVRLQHCGRLAGDAMVEEKDLQVPHPRFRERRFVLEPLAELAPDLVDPVTGLTARDLLARLPD